MNESPQPAPATPSSRWATEGKADPHDDRYACERAALTLGDLTDDELANGAFRSYDRPMDIRAIQEGRADYHPPIVWMTAVKDRIRWLSRSLEKAKAAAIPAPEGADEPEPAAWLVTWKGGEHQYAHAHASELPAVDQARIMGGKCEPLYLAAPAPQATDAELERRTGEPHVDGWPLHSGLPAPAEWLGDPVAMTAFPAAAVAKWPEHNRARMTLKLYTAPQAAPASHAEFALRALVAAGHITQAKADEAMQIAGRVMPQTKEQP